MPGNVDIAGALQRQGIQEVQRVIAVVDRVDVDIVHIQQQLAVALRQHRADELRLAHVAVRLGVVGSILQHQWLAHDVLHLPHPRGHVVHGLLGKGYGQQVVEMAPGGTVGQVLTVESGTDLRRQGFDRSHQFGVDRIRAADIQGQPV